MASAGRRVVIVVQNLPVPFDRRVWLEATALARAGYDVSVICPKAKGYNESYEQLEGVRIHRYRLPGEAGGAVGFLLEFTWCFLRTAMKLLRISTRGGGYDILHVCNPPETYWPLAHVGRLFGKRFLFDHHDLSPEMYAAKFESTNPVLARMLLFLERRTFRAADLVITTNESHRQIAIERGGLAPEDVYVVRSGPDLSRFVEHPPDLAWRKGAAHLVVYLGEMCKQDGVDHLVRAVGVLSEELGRDDIHFAFVGGGPEQPQLVAYAESLGVSHLCTFTGRVSDDDLCRILSSADVAVDPDPKNDWSDKSTMNKIVEYMYFGLPIAAYDLHEARVSAADAALFVEADNERALAKAIVELVDDPDDRRRRGDVGRQRVRTALAWQYSEPVLLEAYERLRGGSTPGADGTRGARDGS